MQQAQLPGSHSLPDIKDSEQERIEETQLTRSELDTLLNAGVISRHTQIVSGAFVFAGTRVPVYNLWDYLAAGDSLEEFLESFPTIPRPLAEKAVALVGERFTRGISRS